MRKSLWIMLAVLSVAVAVPSAQADPLFTYSYSSQIDSLSWTTAPIPVVTMEETIVPAANITAASTSGITAGCTITSVILDAFPGGATATNFSGCKTSAVEVFDNFAQSDYSTPGTYVVGKGTERLVVTATPEPSSGALMLLGVPALLIVTRKRIGHSRPSAV